MANNDEVSVKIGADVADLTSKLKEVGDSFKSVQSDIAKSVADSQLAIANASKQFQQELAAEEEAERKAAAAAYALKEANDQATASTEKSAFATAGSKRELMVIAHEIMTGNFSRIPGSLMVMANRMGGFGAAISGIGAAMMSPLAIAGLLAAAAIGAGIAFVKASEDTKKMNIAIGMTGNFAGQTVTSMHSLADSVSQSANVSVLAASSIVNALVSSGQIGSGAIEEVTKAAAEHSRVTGDNAEKSAAWAEKMFTHPARGAREMSNTMHNLTAAELEHIEMLERTGQSTEAARELAEKYNATAVDQVVHLGLIAEHLNRVAKNWDNLKQVMAGLGSDDPTIALKKEQDALQRLLDNKKAGRGSASEDESIAFRQKNIELLLTQIYEEEDLTKKKTEQAEVNKKDVEVMALTNHTMSAKAEKLREEIARMQELAAIKKGDTSATAQKEYNRLMEATIDKTKELIALEHPSKSVKPKVETSKMPQYEEELNQRKVSMLDTSKGGEGRELSKEEEKAFWQEMLFIADKGSKDYQAIQRKMSGDELATLKEKYKLGLEEAKAAAKEYKAIADEKRAAEEKEALSVIAAKEAEVKQSLAMGEIDKIQELAALRALEDAKYRIRLAAAQSRRDEFALDSIEYQKAADAILVLERAHSTAVITIDNETAREHRRVWMDMAKPITDALDKSVTGVIQGTTTLKKAFADLATSIALEITKMVIKTNIELAMSNLFKLTGGGGGIGDFFGNLFGGGGGGGAGYIPPMFSSAGGEWNVPEDRLNLVHKNETILPASMAAKFRDNLENGGGRGSNTQVTNNFTISGPVDRSTQDQLAMMAAKAMQDAMRRNG